MAKKVKIDFTKTEERSGWNTRQVPSGLYRAKISAVQETEAQDGTAMLVYAFVPEDAKNRTRRFPYYCKLQQNQLWKLRDLLVAGGESVPKRAVSIDPGKIVGRVVVIEVEDDSYNGTVRSSVSGVYAHDILDGEDEPETDVDEEEDDFDQEEDELVEEPEDDLEEDDEDYDEESEDDPEEEDEEELFEDDDEDYDDDYDEEDDEEEPEPEPEPAAKRHPARRASAKAPVARKVQRRK